MKTKYEIIESPPYDKDAPPTFWIKKTKNSFFFKKETIVGNYKIDDSFGELGYMPFFSKSAANKRLKILKNSH